MFDLICGDLCLEKSTKNPGRHKKVVRCRTIQIANELSKHVIPFGTDDTPICNISKKLHQLKQMLIQHMIQDNGLQHSS